MQINDVKTAQMYTFTASMTEAELLSIRAEYRKVVEKNADFGGAFYTTDILKILDLVAQITRETVNATSPKAETPKDFTPVA